MNIFRTPLIATAVLAMTSWAAYAQVRIITPDSEHIYSSDPLRPGAFSTTRPFNEKTNAGKAREWRGKGKERSQGARKSC